MTRAPRPPLEAGIVRHWPAPTPCENWRASSPGSRHAHTRDLAAVTCPACRARLVNAEVTRAAALAAAMEQASREDWDQMAHAAACGADLDEMEAIRAAQERRPDPLHEIPGPVPLLVAAGPGRDYEAWRHVALGVWIAHLSETYRTADLTAETMTAAQLRALLAGRDR
jgi:hypothetical protein